jgi:hypothetical protein
MHRDEERKGVQNRGDDASDENEVKTRFHKNFYRRRMAKEEREWTITM